VGFEDWEFLARAALSGVPIETVPLPLFWYRTGHPRMLLSTAITRNLARVVGTYARLGGAWLQTLLHFAMGRHLRCANLQATYESLEAEYRVVLREFESFRAIHEAYASRPLIRLADGVANRWSRIAWLRRPGNRLAAALVRAFFPRRPGARPPAAGG
jgi:hypothetical protein